MRLLYIHLCSESNTEDLYGIYEGEITTEEQTLLEITAKGGYFAPSFDGAVNAEFVLLSYFVSRYPPPFWRPGDPNEMDYIESAPVEVRAQLEAVHLEWLQKFDFTIESGFIEEFCFDEIVEQYARYMRKQLAEHGSELNTAQREVVKNLEAILCGKEESQSSQ